jgi:hypothetical protein
MSNPDEEPTLHTFGTGAKYFGVASLMATLPGFPVFAHGQIEGLGERYAMDILEPNINESANQELFARHNKEIGPLLRRRDLFGGVENFRFFDLKSINGEILEDIYCFVNGDGHEFALVAFNNSNKKRKGHVKLCAPFNRDSELEEENVVGALNLTEAESWEVQEFPTGNHSNWENKDLLSRGLEISLKPYEAKVFWKFKAMKSKS